jgi:hypothetical protein
VTSEPLNPNVDVAAYNRRFAENDWGILAAICHCIETAGGQVRSYPANTAGIIRALQDLATVIATVTGGSTIINFPMTLGENCAFGDALYIAPDGLAYRSFAGGSRDEATVQGLATEAGLSGAQINVALAGGLVGFTGLTPGAEYFLALTPEGAITNTAPSGAGDFVVKVGEALSTTTFMVRPKVVVELV